MSREIVLIDFGSVYWTAYHSSTNDPVSAAHDRAVSKVRWIAAQNPAAHVAVCCDSPNSFRKRISPEYKANREQKEPAAIEQMKRAKETLRRDGLLIWEADGFEADDLLSTAAVRAQGKKDFVTVWSADKDLLQIVSPSCVVMTTTTNVRMDRDAVFSKWGCEPDQMADMLAICGDKSDNIAGVPGVGPVGAAKLLKRFQTIEALVAEVEKSAQSDPPTTIATPAVDKSLRESVAAMQLAKRLTLLSRDAPIQYDQLFERRETLPLTDNSEEYDMPSEPDILDGVMGPEISSPPREETQIVTRSEAPARDTQLAAPAPSAPSKPISLSRDTGLQPQSLEAALGFAKAVFNSRLYTKFPNAEAIFAVIVRGREMGMGALTALDAFDVIEGRPAPKSHLIIARAKAHPDCEYFRYVGGDETYAEYQTKNRNNPTPTTFKYTIEQARTAGLAPRDPRKDKPPQGKDDRGQWEKRPAEMIRKTAAVQLTRIEYPDAALGLYAAFELGGEE